MKNVLINMGAFVLGGLALYLILTLGFGYSNKVSTQYIVDCSKCEKQITVIDTCLATKTEKVVVAKPKKGKPKVKFDQPIKGGSIEPVKGEHTVNRSFYVFEHEDSLLTVRESMIIGSYTIDGKTCEDTILSFNRSIQLDTPVIEKTIETVVTLQPSISEVKNFVEVPTDRRAIVIGIEGTFFHQNIRRKFIDDDQFYLSGTLGYKLPSDITFYGQYSRNFSTRNNWGLSIGTHIPIRFGKPYQMYR